MNRSAPAPDPLDAARRYQTEAVAAEYERVRFGDRRGALIHGLESRLVLRALRAAGAVRTVLDLPVGTGRLTAALRAAGYDVVGADISAAMLRRAHDRAPGMLVHADGTALPLRPASVDAVICLRLMSHLAAPARMALLGEMARVARMAVIAVYQPHTWSLWSVLRNTIQGHGLPRHPVTQRALEPEFAGSGLVQAQSFALLPGVFMERAYVLTPKRAAAVGR